MSFPSGWNPTPVVIPVKNTNATSALSYFPTGVTITGAAYTFLVAHGKSDLSDLRITDQDRATQLSFALENAATFVADGVINLVVKIPAV